VRGGYLLRAGGRGAGQSHGAFGQIALVSDLPFVVGLGQDGTSEPEQGFRVGEHAHHVGAALDLLVQPLQRVGRPDLLPVTDREGGEGPMTATITYTDDRTLPALAQLALPVPCSAASGRGFGAAGADAAEALAGLSL
jgi:hypothetical protein